VISQIKAIKARPIPQLPPILKADKKDLPTAIAAPQCEQQSAASVTQPQNDFARLFTGEPFRHGLFGIFSFAAFLRAVKDGGIRTDYRYPPFTYTATGQRNETPAETKWHRY
jgi:hypothetical protein